MSQITSKGEVTPTYISEKKIKELAPDAKKFLERKDALDLVEILGLEDET